MWLSLNHHIDSLTPTKSSPGVLIVLEGIDGSGKTSQTRRLISKVEDITGKRPVSFDFPNYEGSINGKILSSYLKGEFGPLDSIDPKVAALWYAGDRLEGKSQLAESLERGDIVILNRYVPSNEAYGRAKFTTQKEMEQFSAWLHGVEYETNGLPKPDLVLVMDVEESTAAEFLKGKGDRQYLGGSGLQLDQHESNRGYQSRVRAEYLRLCNQRPHWERVPVSDKETTHQRIMEKVSALISSKNKW